MISWSGSAAWELKQKTVENKAATRHKVKTANLCLVVCLIFCFISKTLRIKNDLWQKIYLTKTLILAFSMLPETKSSIAFLAKF